MDDATSVPFTLAKTATQASTPHLLFLLLPTHCMWDEGGIGRSWPLSRVIRVLYLSDKGLAQKQVSQSGLYREWVVP